MRIPPRKECLQMLSDTHMPDHIQAHSRLVCRVALKLTDALIAAGVPLNRSLVTASALLHDITKPRSFTTGENHSQTGGEYLTDMGYPEVGNVIRQHVILDAYFQDENPNEAEIINYADKRVLHDRVVPLNDRMDYITERYAKTDLHRQWMKKMRSQTELLEKRLFAYLDFSPSDLIDHLP